MKTLLATLIALVTLSSCTNRRVVITDAEIPEEVFFLKEDIKPYSGTCVTYYYNTENVKEEMRFVDGILHGASVSYYPDGSVKRKGSYNNGKMEGKWESWYPNGTQSYVACFANDSLSGNYTAWYDTGVMKEKGHYEKNLRQGEWIRYDQSGMITLQEVLN